MNKTIVNTSTEMNKNAFTVVKGLSISIIITLVSIFIFAFFITYTEFSESGIASVIIGITAFSILIGTFISTLKLPKNGMINGGVIGFLYMFSLYVISSGLGAGFEINVNSVIMLILGVIAGMIGRNCWNKY